MYFERFTPITESVKFTIQNLIDVLTLGDPDPVTAAEKKLQKVRDTFDQYYRFDKETEDYLNKQITIFAKQSTKVEPLDIEKIDKFHHLHLRFKIALNGQGISREDFQKFYTLFFRASFASQLPSQMTKYTMPIFINNKYLVFLTFDEKSIDNIYLLTSVNMLDLRAPIFLMYLPFNRAKFQKENHF